MMQFFCLFIKCFCLLWCQNWSKCIIQAILQQILAQLYISGGCFEYESRKDRGISQPHICRDLLKDVVSMPSNRAKLIPCNMTYHSVASFEDFRRTAVRKASSIDHFNITHCILNRLSHTIYWKSPILGAPSYEILHIPREKMAKLFANSGDPDQTPRSAASDLGLHCLLIILLRASRLQWVKKTMGRRTFAKRNV